MSEREAAKEKALEYLRANPEIYAAVYCLVTDLCVTIYKLPLIYGSFKSLREDQKYLNPGEELLFVTREDLE